MSTNNVSIIKLNGNGTNKSIIKLTQLSSKAAFITNNEDSFRQIVFNINKSNTFKNMATIDCGNHIYTIFSERLPSGYICKLNSKVELVPKLSTICNTINTSIADLHLSKMIIIHYIKRGGAGSINQSIMTDVDVAYTQFNKDLIIMAKNRYSECKKNISELFIQ